MLSLTRWHATPVRGLLLHKQRNVSIRDKCSNYYLSIVLQMIRNKTVHSCIFYTILNTRMLSHRKLHNLKFSINSGKRQILVAL